MNRQVSIVGQEICVDGKATQFRSGSIHYFRVHPALWEDRLLKLKQCGLNTVETYLPWNLHEEEEGQFRFDGWLDIRRYVELAASLGLMVILRPGPFICSEWDFGGLPAWLLRKQGMHIRCCSKPFLDAVDRYFAQLLPILKELQWTHGGPVVMMQVDNEYGGVGNDQEYLRHLYNLHREAGIDVPLFISDWGTPNILEAGSLAETLVTVNCPSHPARHLANAPRFRPVSPKFVMELWSGVARFWSSPWKEHSAQDVARDVEELLRENASFNLYMFHGGTSFGFMPGAARKEGRYLPYLTSYDVDAPLNETGNPTPKYFAIQRVIRQHCPDAFTAPPARTQLKSLPPVEFSESAPLFANLPALTAPIEDIVPQPMEQYGQNYGFILYRTDAHFRDETAELSLCHLADQAWIFVDGRYYGTITANSPAPIIIPPGRLDILVENQGRINKGMGCVDNWSKGICGAILNQRRLYHWQVFPLPLKDLSRLPFCAFENSPTAPRFHRATFTVDEPADTSIRIPFGTHGQVFLNGFNLGKYRSTGPQFSLYAPAPLFHKGTNELVILELQGLRENRVDFLDHTDHEPATNMYR
ncbi:MAG: beta-galactosidase [Victivallales bacterium]|nr:beta-galactosidase [Victivallales bacterium]